MLFKNAPDISSAQFQVFFGSVAGHRPFRPEIFFGQSQFGKTLNDDNAQIAVEIRDRLLQKYGAEAPSINIFFSYFQKSPAQVIKTGSSYRHVRPLFFRRILASVIKSWGKYLDLSAYVSDGFFFARPVQLRGKIPRFKPKLGERSRQGDLQGPVEIRRFMPYACRTGPPDNKIVKAYACQHLAQFPEFRVRRFFLIREKAFVDIGPEAEDPVSDIGNAESQVLFRGISFFLPYKPDVLPGHCQFRKSPRKNGNIRAEHVRAYRCADTHAPSRYGRAEIHCL